jgi:hypothetical protein
VCFQIGFTEFRLSTSEQDELISKIRDYPPYQQHIGWLPEFVQSVRSDASGHIGILRCFLQFVIMHFDSIKHVPSLDEALQFYHGPFLSESICPRFFRMPADELSLSEKLILENALLGPVAVPPPAVESNESDDNRAKRLLIRSVILAVEGNFLVYATPLHRRFYFRAIFPSHIPNLPARFFNSIEDWLLLVFQTFEPRKLAEHMSQGSNAFSKEIPLQHAFWRGASFCLPPSYRIGAEVSRCLDHDTKETVTVEGTMHALVHCCNLLVQTVMRRSYVVGAVDFWINSDLRWAVELVRNGNRLGEHVGRLAVGGKYARLKPLAARVVDFRPVCDPQDHGDTYMAVLVAEDYRSAEIRTNTRTTHVQFTGNPPDSSCSVPEWHPR